MISVEDQGIKDKKSNSDNKKILPFKKFELNQNIDAAAEYQPIEPKSKVQRKKLPRNLIKRKVDSLPRISLDNSKSRQD